MPRKVGKTTYWRLDEILSGYNTAIKLLKDAQKSKGQKRIMCLLRAHKLLNQIQYEWVRKCIAYRKKRHRKSARFDIYVQSRSNEAGIREEVRYDIIEECSD